MKFNDKIFYIGIVLILVANKSFELINSFEMVISPIETSVKITIMALLTYELIKIYLLPKRNKAC